MFAMFLCWSSLIKFNLAWTTATCCQLKLVKCMRNFCGWFGWNSIVAVIIADTLNWNRSSYCLHYIIIWFGYEEQLEIIYVVKAFINNLLLYVLLTDLIYWLYVIFPLSIFQDILIAKINSKNERFVWKCKTSDIFL